MARCTCPKTRMGTCDYCTTRIEDGELFLEYGVNLVDGDTAADRYEQALWNALEGT